MDNNLPLISINFYDESDEVTKTFEKNGVRWGVLKKAITLGKSMDVKNFSEKDYDKISSFVCEVFGGQFTSKELEENANFDDVLNVFKAVINKANGVNPN